MTGSQEPAFRYAERRPAAVLQPWVHNYWWFAVGDGAPPVHHVPPDGCTALVVHLAGTGPAMLSGPWLEPLGVPIRAGDRYAGIRFQPGALEPLFGIAARSMRNRVVPAPEGLQAVGHALRSGPGSEPGPDTTAATLDGLLPGLVAGHHPRDPLVALAVDRLVATDGELGIGSLAAELAVSDRTLRRRFQAATGLRPKEFARIRRLLAAAWAMSRGAPTWSAAAHAAGYADQPHLHRDVADFTGLTPGMFGKRIQATEHDDVVP